MPPVSLRLMRVGAVGCLWLGSQADKSGEACAVGLLLR